MVHNPDRTHDEEYAAWEREVFSQEQRDEVARVIPTGYYRGFITGFESEQPSAPQSPLVGERLAKVTAVLDVDGRERTFVFRLAQRLLRYPSGRVRAEFLLLCELIRLLGLRGKRTSQVLAAAMDGPLGFKIRQSPQTEKYQARAWLDEIRAWEG